MKSTTFIGTVENGQIKLIENVALPEDGLVYVVGSGSASTRTAYFASPRLVHPEQAADFVLEVEEGASNAGV